ncbi:S41 family peptidase [Gemmatimonadota bacterium]
MARMSESSGPHGSLRILLLGLVCLALALPSSALSQDQTRLDDPSRKTEIIQEIARLLEAHYVLPDEAQAFADALRARHSSGAYDRNVNAGDFAEAVTADLVDITGDSHVQLRVIDASDLEEDTESPLHHPIRLTRLGQTEHLGFRKLEWLPGNVGYLDLIRFYPISESKKMVDGAMRFLSTADAVIIDLRDNGGGACEGLSYWCSFFLPYPTQLTSYYARGDDFLTEFWTMEDVGGGRLRDVPLFLLTSKRTFSASEMLAYDMQVYGRATLVGEATGGGANSVDLFPIDGQFEIYISTSRAINPLTADNWEGVGVIPDVAVPSESALDTAIVLATAAGQENARIREENLGTDIGEMELLMARAEASFRHGRTEEAAAALDSLIEVGERAGLMSDFFLDLLSYSYLSESDEPVLIPLLRKKAQLFPSSDAYEALGYAYQMFGNTELAIESYGKALEMNPAARNAAKMIRRLRGG